MDGLLNCGSHFYSLKAKAGISHCIPPLAFVRVASTVLRSYYNPGEERRLDRKSQTQFNRLMPIYL